MTQAGRQGSPRNSSGRNSSERNAGRRHEPQYAGGRSIRTRAARAVTLHRAARPPQRSRRWFRAGAGKRNAGFGGGDRPYKAPQAARGAFR